MTLPMMYTPEEVADQLKVTRRSVYAWLLEGRLKGKKAGDTWRIAEPDLNRFLDTRNASRVLCGPDHPDYKRWLKYFRRVGITPAKAAGKKGL